MSRPVVSFLIPVAEPAPFVRKALESVRDQTFSDWELVLVLDGPSRDARETATQIVPANRLKIVQRPERGGIAKALNDGLAVCKGQYIARLDADDWAAPERLSVQVEKMKSRPDLVLLGSSAVLVDQSEYVLGQRAMESGSRIYRGLLWRNQFVHSSVMFRRDAALRLGGYSEQCYLREDYEFWLRLASSGEIDNLSEQLVSYRISDLQSSRGRSDASATRLVVAGQRSLARNRGFRGIEVALAVAAWRVRQTATVYPSVRRILGTSLPALRKAKSSWSK